MAAPIFSEDEVARLMAMPKHVRFEDWEGKWSCRDGADDKVRIKVYPAEPEDDDAEFLIEREERRYRGEIFITLVAKLPQRRHPVCRYDLQQGIHRNPKWIRPRVVPPRAFHRHVYNSTVTDHPDS